MLSNKDMLLFVAYFYLINMNHIRNQYILGNAYWWELKWAYLAEALGNLVLNIILGRMLGITGVLIATIITIFICNYLMVNSVLFRTYFRNESILTFYRQQFYYLTAAIITTAAVYLICSRSDSILVRAAICIVIPNILLALLYRPCSRWMSSMEIIKRFVRMS